MRLIGGAAGTALGPARPENYLADQPFGQVPVYKEGALCLFESGAIVLHIGAKDERLLPRDESGRARAITWMIAALNSIEPQTFMLAATTIFFGDAPWSAEAGAALRPWSRSGLRISPRRSATRIGWKAASRSAT